MYGLLTETERSIDGNWTDCWRKLHGLLMDRVQSIDVNNPADFLHFGCVKMWFCRVLKPTVSGTSSFLHLTFCILDVRKCDFAESGNQGFKCEQIFCILAAWKFDCGRFVITMFQVTSQRLWKFFFIFEAWKCDNFLQYEARNFDFFPSRESDVSWVPNLVLEYFLHFGGL